MWKSMQFLLVFLGIFMLVGLRNVSLGQIGFGLFNGFIVGTDTTYGQWVDYQRENTKRGIGKIQPYNGKPYSNNDF